MRYMPRYLSFDQPTEGVELGNLLATTIGSVVEAQERMDDYTLRRKQEFEQSPDWDLALPPLWYVFDKVAVEVELSATIRSSQPLPPRLERGSSGGSLVRGSEERPNPRLFCHTLNPTMVSLYGYQASAGLKIRLQFGPRGVLPLKHIEEVPW
jgi:hypothetical protein